MWKRYSGKTATAGWMDSPVGKTFFSGLPKKIASDLGLSKPETYTGHCFRHSAATIFADAGASTMDLKRLGDWKSDQIVARYVHKSAKFKSASSATIMGVPMAVDNDKENTVPTQGLVLDTGSQAMNISSGNAPVALHFHFTNCSGNITQTWNHK